MVRPAPQLLPVLRPPQLARLDVQLPELAARDAELLHRGDSLVEGHVPEAVALESDEDAAEPRLGRGGPPQGPRQDARRGRHHAAESQPVPFASRELRH